MTCDLLALADWLMGFGVTHVAMESTGVYWKPIWNVLEGRFELLLVNAQHFKAVPGRKTDVKDCEWLAELLQHGLVRSSFVPPTLVRDLRDLNRNRAILVQQRATVSNRIEKVLEDANIKLGAVASHVLGQSGRAMLHAMSTGEEDIDKQFIMVYQKPVASKPGTSATST
jgi:transposase